MGCDIHAYAEKVVECGDIKFWHCCDHFALSAYQEHKIMIGQAKTPKYEFDNIYRGRNYLLFEALAGVRGDENKAMFDIKWNIPNDASRIVKETYEEGKEDYHTASYLTIKELFSVKSKRTYHHKGYVTPENAQRIASGDYTDIQYTEYRPIGGLTEYVEWSEEFDPLERFKQVYFESFKQEFYFSYCNDERVLNEIMGDKGDKYRIVFWFDN